MIRSFTTCWWWLAQIRQYRFTFFIYYEGLTWISDENYKTIQYIMVVALHYHYSSLKYCRKAGGGGVMIGLDAKQWRGPQSQDRLLVAGHGWRASISNRWSSSTVSDSPSAQGSLTSPALRGSRPDCCCIPTTGVNGHNNNTAASDMSRKGKQQFHPFILGSFCQLTYLLKWYILNPPKTYFFIQSVDENIKMKHVCKASLYMQIATRGIPFQFFVHSLPIIFALQQENDGAR